MKLGPQHCFNLFEKEQFVGEVRWDGVIVALATILNTMICKYFSVISMMLSLCLQHSSNPMVELLTCMCKKHP